IALPACTGGSQAVGGTTVNSTVDANYVNCGAGGGSEGQRGVWYTLAGSNNQVTISTCDPSVGLDSRLTVYQGSCGALSCVTANEDIPGDCTGASAYSSEVVFNAIQGTTYYVFVHGYGSPGETGDFMLHISCAPLCLPLPVNDICASAQPLTVELDCMPTTGSTNCATESIGVYPGCASPYHTFPDVYYSFTSPNTASGDVSLNITDITAN